MKTPKIAVIVIDGILDCVITEKPEPVVIVHMDSAVGQVTVGDTLTRRRALKYWNDAALRAGMIKSAEDRYHEKDLEDVLAALNITY